jgi:hypothetical protein
MSNKDNNPAPDIHGLTPLPRDRWPEELRKYPGETMVFGPIPPNPGGADGGHLVRMRWCEDVLWGVVYSGFADSRAWAYSPKAALEAAGLDPAVLDQMRAESDVATKAEAEAKLTALHHWKWGETPQVGDVVGMPDNPILWGAIGMAEVEVRRFDADGVAWGFVPHLNQENTIRPENFEKWTLLKRDGELVAKAPAPTAAPAPSIRAVGPGRIEAERHDAPDARISFPDAQALFHFDGQEVRVFVCGCCYRLTCTPDEARAAIVDAINRPKS